MTEAPIERRWTRDEFVRAWEAGEFDHRVELIEGEVWPVGIGDWHGETLFRVVRTLPGEGVVVTGASLPTGDSLPDPDCWIRRQGSEAIGKVGRKISMWHPADVLLLVEVSHETVREDLGIKARLYSRDGYEVYWVVTEGVIYEHTDPTPTGYRTVREYHPGQLIPVHYADTAIAVDELLYPDRG
ncbi:Uma2 family endonuclease [Nocardia sp. XZ_19_385]|uniref:Uma2 family endonuclease n=1 Tax=Nocardia sp. XZ_19_385 TaxID=2769488 RepID=UPI00188E544D|nr:Uma2 family endonuclease [Nocardia sp. XZ_19_385]